jgi:hypothetical protein
MAVNDSKTDSQLWLSTAKAITRVAAALTTKASVRIYRDDGADALASTTGAGRAGLRADMR